MSVNKYVIHIPFNYNNIDGMNHRGFFVISQVLSKTQSNKRIGFKVYHNFLLNKMSLTAIMDRQHFSY